MHVYLPIGIGACIYVLFRDTSLLVFRWLDVAGLGPFTSKARQLAEQYVYIPYAVLVTVPDGLWVYAGTAWMCLIWNWRVNVWTLLPVSIGVFSELGQLWGMVPGWFDPFDLLLVSVAFPSAWFASKAHLQCPTSTSVI